MTDVRSWANTAASNNQQPPDGWPENQLPSTVNDCAREDMAAVRRQFEAAQWFDEGDTPTYVSATSFTVVGDKTAFYVAGRAFWAEDATNLYGVIVSSAYSSPNTTVTVRLFSGSLSASILQVNVGIITPTNNAIPAFGPFYQYQTKSGDYTIVYGDRGSLIDFTATANADLPAANLVATTNPGFIIAIGNTGAGTVTIRRAGSDTIDGATSLAVAAGKTVLLMSDGSSVWRRIASYGL